MEAFKILFTTDVGLMSLAVIVFIIGMAVFFARHFARRMREDALAAQSAKIAGAGDRASTAQS